MLYITLTFYFKIFAQFLASLSYRLARLQSVQNIYRVYINIYVILERTPIPFNMITSILYYIV